jgi:cytochrome c peroxidase
MCHIPEQGFTSNEMATAVGVEGRSVRRNSPTLYNVAYIEKLFHDGREENLEQQVWGPFLAKNEMANPSIGYLLGKIRSFPDYDGLFEEAYDGRPVGMETLGSALAVYQRTLLSANSPFDRWRYGRESTALDSEARRGFDLFTGKAGCSACHLVNDEYALFTDNRLHNTGLGYQNSIGGASGPNRVTLAPGVFLDVDPEVIATVGEKPPADVGLYEVTEDPADRWKYRTPTLRNIALTGPYMHNGQFSTLEEVISFYNDGGVENEVLSPLIRPLKLDAQEQRELVAFLNALTGDNVDALVLDAFAAPVSDP